MSFEDLNMNAAILKAIAETGYTEPMPIQAQAIRNHRRPRPDGFAQTGSGKPPPSSCPR